MSDSFSLFTLSLGNLLPYSLSDTDTGMIMKPGARLLAVTAMLAMTFAPLSASAETKSVEIHFEHGTISPLELSLVAGETVMLVIKNIGQTPVEFESRLLHAEKIIPSGKEVTVELKDPKPGTYDFFDDFHPSAGKGAIVVK